MITNAISELIEVIGEAATRKVVAEYGGRVVHFTPQTPRPDDSIICESVWRTLCEHIRGPFYVPNSWRPAGRDERIREQRANGATIGELVEEHRLSSRQIIRICQG